MADTYTPHYSFTLVEVGASRDTWGAKTNQNWGVNDDRVSELQTQITNNLNNLQTQITNNNNNLYNDYISRDNALRSEFQNWVPIGTVCLWVLGNTGNVPGGWAPCDGRTVTRTDGQGSLTTPNMMSRFVLADPNCGAVGGNYTGSVWSDVRGAHSHGGGTGGTALTLAQMPSHQHGGGLPSSAMTGAQNTGGNAAHTPRGLTDAAGSGAAHSHTIGGDGDHQHVVTMTIVPQYFTAIYIMRY